jgi:predicted RND superfamily exporter protein
MAAPAAPNNTSSHAITDAIFRARAVIVFIFVVITLALGYQVTKLRPDASFEKMVPTTHPYIINFLQNKDDLSALGNAVRIIVAANDGDIFSKDFQETLRKINDDVFYIQGVDRGKLESIWTPNVRWREVTEDGFVGGAVIPDTYDGSPKSIEQLRSNVLRSGTVGRLVSNDYTAAIIYAPLAAKAGERLDYVQISRDLEQIRSKYQGQNVSIHITGFVKVIGDLIEGAVQVGIFFVVAFFVTAILLYAYARCTWSTAMPLLCSLIAVIWQLGLLHTLGFGIDPYSMLVPFLIFAIGISHAVQMINSVAHNSLEGMDKYDAARFSFQNLFWPGFAALLCDVIGFITLYVIDIPVIQELALTSSLGVVVLILTNLVLLPILMSYTGITKNCVDTLKKRRASSTFSQWRTLSKFASIRWAGPTVVAAFILFALGSVVGRETKIGDLDPGAPELRADSRYNTDNAFLTQKFSTSTDVFVVMVHTPVQQCGNYQALSAINRFQATMMNVAGVQSVMSLVDVSKLVVTGMNEANIKWHDVSRNQYVLNNSLRLVPSALLNTDCSMVPVLVFLNNHKADTLKQVEKAASEFIAKYSTPEVEFKLAAGNAGVETATNIVIDKAQYLMLALVYGVVAITCLLTFRSVKIVICLILPLALTSILGHALMAVLGIGVKVATLPVISLGVGIGVDYGIYLYNRLRDFMKDDRPLIDAYFETLKSTGTAIAFTGVTLAIGVGTWIFSPIKFQADMGLMLTFMFIWNMLGALILLPALTRLLHRGA